MIVDELFKTVDLSPKAQTVIDQATETAELDPDEALATVNEEFNSVCDRESPAEHEVDETGRTSRCLRHRAEYASPEDT